VIGQIGFVAMREIFASAGGLLASRRSPYHKDESGYEEMLLPLGGSPKPIERLSRDCSCTTKTVWSIKAAHLLRGDFEHRVLSFLTLGPYFGESPLSTRRLRPDSRSPHSLDNIAPAAAQLRRSTGSGTSVEGIRISLSVS